ncbi:glycyl-tRNA synthetase beta chain [Legionella beliardensis]|uniref:Glycine--tRNA ligase beta subunit n=1 Tax=Legionella beliardensis TaxID=91822 RepID=A0A378I347_9GAMM|nr:glycine--tRNA ligase subunit beta [Legionella beliardensis]STX29599.1 glycyl-tRNA synthetase beta chain [Legionella beliardensis]
MVNNFLFELGCEELPSGAVGPLSEALVKHIKEALAKLELHYGAITAYAAPRRLAILINDLVNEQPTQRQVRRGPAKAAAYNAQNEPTPALLGFAKSCNVAIDALTISQTDKGEWVVYESEIAGAKVSTLLPTVIKEALASLPIAKPMRWGEGDAEFARPVHWIVMLLGQDVLPCEILGVQAGKHTYGHRFHAPQAISIDNPCQYETRLQDAYVIADFAKRREIILKQLNEKAKENNAQAVLSDDLINEVTSIVEWPEVLVAHFDKEFLEVPAETLIAAMQTHQKCFALRDENGQLLSTFLTVANIQSTSPKQVIAGNEKVMRARLSDAAFFFEQDKKRPLSHHIAATAKVIFQAKLGTLLDKATRMQTLMGFLIEKLHLTKPHALRAAELSKCDLMTGMVGEFPELQGLMGYYYALNDGEDKDVAVALHEQYLPRFAGDELPKSALGMSLSLADRLDTLLGIFAIGQRPTGVKDPFKLRRHALAVVRLLITSPHSLSLAQLIDQTAKTYSTPLVEQAQEISADLKSFILERQQSYYLAQGISVDFVQAVRARQHDELDDFDKRINALKFFASLPDAAMLSAACKRVNNLLQQEETQEYQLCLVDESLLQEEAEQSLFSKLQDMKQSISSLYETKDYVAILTQLATLRPTVDAFFENVMVMVNNTNTKKNRLVLLSHLQDMLQGVADISELQFT